MRVSYLLPLSLDQVVEYVRTHLDDHVPPADLVVEYGRRRAEFWRIHSARRRMLAFLWDKDPAHLIVARRVLREAKMYPPSSWRPAIAWAIARGPSKRKAHRPLSVTVRNVELVAFLIYAQRLDPGLLRVRKASAAAMSKPQEMGGPTRLPDRLPRHIIQLAATHFDINPDLVKTIASQARRRGW